MPKLRSLQGHNRFQSKLRKAIDEQKYGKKNYGKKPAPAPPMKPPRKK